MPLKNYTSEVSAMKSIGQIQENLVVHGARAIMINYDAQKQPESMSFILVVGKNDVPFRLPANVKKVEAILLKARVRKPETWQSNYQSFMTNIREQAARTAWRIIKDWIDAQLAIIETEMVTIEQVFLPYMVMPDERTLYESMVNRGFLLTEGRG